MKDEWWNEVERIYHAARELQGDERSRFLDSACKADSAIFRQVDAMLRNEEQEKSFLIKPAIHLAPNVVLCEGMQLGPYQVLASIGTGGMGQVYRARDTRLKRDVAIKTLTDEFALDPDRLARFDREATVLASLNHPNIAAIHDVVELDGCRYLVLELVEGMTLAERLSKDSLTVEETLKIGVQIAEALEVAHERGIVHRDLKPANIKVTSEGKVKVLDFGLAKAFHSPDSNKESSVTRTQEGDVLGTPAYMSPEQARGQTIDRRADIWAFGCVIYELLTGRKAFHGDTASDTIASILTGDPDWTAVPANAPLDLRRLLRRCLNKDLRHRLQSAGAIRIELEEMDSKVDLTSQIMTTSKKRPSRFVWASVIGLLALVAILQFVMLFKENAPPSTQPVRFFIYPPEGYSFATYSRIAISPDGRQVAFVMRSGNRQGIGLQPLDSFKSRLLEGTDDGGSPFWSPDNQSIGFFAQGKLKVVDIAGGAPRTLCNAAGAVGGTWNAGDVIVFAMKTQGTSLYRTSAIGGEPELLHFQEDIYKEGPTFLPDGLHFIYNGGGNRPEQAGLYIGALDSAETTRVGDIPRGARFAQPGYLVFEQKGSMYAQSFDADRNRLSGTPIPLREFPAGGLFSFSENGVMINRDESVDTQLVWFDRNGRKLDAVGPVGKYLSPQLSPDGKRIAVASYDEDRKARGSANILLIDALLGVPSRWTLPNWPDDRPVWSPDGTRIVISSSRGFFDLYIGPSQRQGDPELLYESRHNKRPADWSADERLLYDERDEAAHWDLWTMSVLHRKQEPVRITQTPWDENSAQFEPSSGRWIAYASNEPGDFNVYLQDIGDPRSKKPVSTKGGVQPRWRRDGKELFYIGADESLMTVKIRDRASMDFGTPERLFKTTSLFLGTNGYSAAQYAVSADGQRFLLNTVVEGSRAPIAVVLNWTAMLDRK